MGELGGSGRLCLLARVTALGAGCLLLANCSGGIGKVDSKYGVKASARVIAPGEPVPKGGGVYRVGKPYKIAGRTYVPEEDVHYKATGLASWYGDDFHGRYTANGEIFDMNSISAAHPTLPLPSYVRVTNVANHRSIVVRVNDRGPYVGNRVIDLSVRTAKLLDFHGQGVAKVKVEYVGRAPLAGSDDRKLMATLRGGAPETRPPVMIASSKPYAPTYFDTRPMDQRALVPRPAGRPFGTGESASDAPADAREAHRHGPATEIAAVMLPARAESAMPAPIRHAESPVTTVSAYAPTRYDGHAGFMSGRGLY